MKERLDDLMEALVEERDNESDADRRVAINVIITQVETVIALWSNIGGDDK